MESHWSAAALERFHQALQQLTAHHEAPGAPSRLTSTALEQMPEFACRAALVAQLLHRL
ncbi:hypothetical protein D3C78_1881360 [compost metagenome]